MRSAFVFGLCLAGWAVVAFVPVGGRVGAEQPPERVGFAPPPQTLDERTKQDLEFREEARKIIAAKPGERRLEAIRKRKTPPAAFSDFAPMAAESGDDELRRLLKDRYNAIGDELGYLKSGYEVGLVKFDELADTTHRLVEAGLELCRTPEERLTLLASSLEMARLHERRMEESFGAGGQATQGMLYKSRAIRIDAELRLFRAKREAGRTK